MFGVGQATRVYLAVGATDMRQGYNGLIELARSRLESDPLSGHLFVFCNRRKDRIKVLVWDGSGMWICAKRLERGRYSWPEGTVGRVQLTQEELALLLGGIELERTRHKNWWRRKI